LVIEITETAVLTDVAPAVETLNAMRERGVRVALDDFGIGFSSLLRLRDLPFDCLKIDREFVSGIALRDDGFSIVASVIHMTQTLGIDCIAEGVETVEQLEQLRRLGCRSAQGFLWSPAVAIEQVPIAPGVAPADRRAASRTASPADPATEAVIMRLHATGASLHAIAAELNQSGSRTRRGTRWQSRTVAHVVSYAAFPQIRR
jgi:EAL domain-containing protein (putative c-di-GMP-specific phosphodiesterase class I)